MEINKHFDLLGCQVKDRVTNYKGIVVSISFDLFGCIQAVIKPVELTKDGGTDVGEWFDVSRLKVLNKKPVMNVPNYIEGNIARGEKGPSMKPDHQKFPIK